MKKKMTLDQIITLRETREQIESLKTPEELQLYVKGRLSEVADPETFYRQLGILASRAAKNPTRRDLYRQGVPALFDGENLRYRGL